MTKLLILAFIVAGVGMAFEFFSRKNKQKPDLSVYEKKPFLFDAVSELNLYKMLVELYGDRYCIFTQVNYSHLIEPKKNLSWTEKQKYRSRIDRKSADFVLCDKVRVVPQLVIELDGYEHNYNKKHARDEFVNDIMKISDLKILHIRTGDVNREFVKGEIDKKLNIV